MSPPTPAPARAKPRGALMATARPRADARAIPHAALVASAAFGPRLAAARVAQEIARGLRAGGAPAPDVCPIARHDGRIAALLADLNFDARMRRARAVIVAERRLDERTLEGSAAFEMATRARQAGVPSYAVTAENRLDEFDARILDLQLIIVAATPRALAAAGRRLARAL